MADADFGDVGGAKVFPMFGLGNQRTLLAAPVGGQQSDRLRILDRPRSGFPRLRTRRVSLRMKVDRSQEIREASRGLIIKSPIWSLAFHVATTIRSYER